MHGHRGALSQCLRSESMQKVSMLLHLIQTNLVVSVMILSRIEQSMLTQCLNPYFATIWGIMRAVGRYTRATMFPSQFTWSSVILKSDATVDGI